MGSFIEIFDENKMRYIARESTMSEYVVNLSESDYKRIEAALIRFADDLRIAN